MQTARSLVSSPRRPALSGCLAETDWHLAFRTPQSFQAKYTGLFNEVGEVGWCRWGEGVSVTWAHAEKEMNGGEERVTDIKIAEQRAG